LRVSCSVQTLKHAGSSRVGERLGERLHCSPLS
jgi:hypothetical protein